MATWTEGYLSQSEEGWNKVADAAVQSSMQPATDASKKKKEMRETQ